MRMGPVKAGNRARGKPSVPCVNLGQVLVLNGSTQHGPWREDTDRENITLSTCRRSNELWNTLTWLSPVLIRSASDSILALILRG